MKEYYFELRDRSGKKNYRLQKNKVLWRPLDCDEFSPKDFITTDAAEAIRILNEIEGGTRVIKVNDLLVRLKIREAMSSSLKMSA